MAATSQVHSYGVLAANLGSPAIVSRSHIRKLPHKGTGLGHSTLASRAYVRSCHQKIDSSSEYASFSRRQKNNLAITLTDPRKTKKVYFSDYLREEDLIVLVCSTPVLAVKSESAESPYTAETTHNEQRSPAEPPATQGTTGEPTPALEPTIIQDEKIELIEGLSDFSVKLHFTFDEDENSILVALQVGEQVMEWTRDSLIKPHNQIPQDTLLTIDLSYCTMKTLVTRAFNNPNSEVHDQVTKLCEARDCLIDHIVQQITVHNRYYKYQKDIRDSQNFVNYILGSLMIERLPRVSSCLNEYITELRDNGSALPILNHVELDNYMKKHSEGMSVGMMEYMALLYYQHHLDSRATAHNPGSETWLCPVDQCQLTQLLLKLNNKQECRPTL